MDSLAIHGAMEEKAYRFIQRLNAAVEICKNYPQLLTLFLQLPPLIFKLYWTLIYTFVEFKNMRNGFDVAINRCNQSCKVPEECADRFCEIAIKIRDHLIYLDNHSKESVVLFPFRNSLSNAATEWDDFVEDCTIASDPEVKELLGQIANAA